jgi:hypothetical protein
VLKDREGHAVSGTTGVTFAIYAEEISGAPLWMETQNVVTNAVGRYLVSLGSTKTEGLPGELFPEGEPRWLGIQILLPGEVERRIPLRAAEDRIVVKHEMILPPNAKKVSEEQSEDSELTPSENQTAQQDPNATAPDSQQRTARSHRHRRHLRPN